MTLDEAVSASFLAFSASYSRKWDTPQSAVPVWASILGSIGAKPEEVFAAATAWCASRDWPPSLAELRGAIPRFCRCGKCIHCSRRAHAQASRLASHGCHGGEESPGPASVSATTAKLLERHARKELTP